MGLGEKLREAIQKFTGRSVVDENAVKQLIKDLQRVLIAGDVEVKLVFQLSKKIEERIKKEETKGASLREHTLKIVYEELEKLLQGEKYSPEIKKKRIMLVGLYGSGKTTTAGKLALFYKNRGLSVAVVGADFDRPAAREQLKQLAEKIGVKYYSSGNNTEEAVKNAIKESKEDVIIIDTAGRNAFNDELGEEIKNIYNISKPEEVFLVLPADSGKVAKKHAMQFNEFVPLNGVVITRMEGSGKGGGALSSVASLKIPVAFIGTGEKLEDLEIFDAKKFVGKLLGVPDLAGLIEKVKEVQRKFDIKEEDLEEFTVENFYKQLQATKSMGSLSGIMASFGMSNVPKDMIKKSEEEMQKFEAIINSMTKEERKHAEIITKERGRVERIAKGAGVKSEDVRKFLNQFFKMEKMMKKLKGNRNVKKRLEGLLKGGFKGGGIRI